MAQIEFRGYAGDCIIQGRLDVPDDVRLTDFLNKSETYPVAEMSLYSLDDGHVVPAGEQQLEPDEIWAVEPTDENARSDLHLRTREVEVELDMPPYRVTGFLHGINTGDPLAALDRRGRMIPLTDSVIRFTYAAREISRDAPVLVVNRDKADSIKAIAYERTKIDEIPLPPTDPNAVDTTSEIIFDPGR